MRPMGTVAYGGKGQGKGKGRGEGRLGQGGRGRSKGVEKLMGTTAYGGKGSKGRAANGDRPVGAASCRRDHHTMASCQNPPPALVAPTQSDNRKVGCTETTEDASTNKSLTNDVERQEKEEQAKQQERENQDDKGTKEVEDGDTDSDVSILTWLQGLKTRGEGGQMEGQKGFAPGGGGR